MLVSRVLRGKYSDFEILHATYLSCTRRKVPSRTRGLGCRSPSFDGAFRCVLQGRGGAERMSGSRVMASTWLRSQEGPRLWLVSAFSLPLELSGWAGPSGPRAHSSHQLRERSQACPRLGPH